MRIAGIEPESAVDGPGLRFALFMQGCERKCAGCHNPETWDRLGGTETDVPTILKLIDDEIGLISGVTISGGEPLLQPSAVAQILVACKERGLHTALFTGFKYEEIPDAPDIQTILKNLDLLVDGEFILSQRSEDLLFRGSRNQRLIDVQKTLENGKVVIWNGGFTR